MKKPIWNQCSSFGETRRLISTSRNWKLSRTEFLSKDTNPFLKMFSLQAFFSHFYYNKWINSRLANMEDSLRGTAWKSVQIRIYFWSVFSCIWIEYGEICSLHIQSEYRKIRTRNNSVFGHFSRSESVHLTLPLYIFLSN